MLERVMNDSYEVFFSYDEKTVQGMIAVMSHFFTKANANRVVLVHH